MTRRLHIVERPETRELPSGELLVATVRRPGELHDVVTVDEAVASKIAAKATASRIDVNVAATLLVEMHLLAADLKDVGSAPVLPPEAAPPRRRLSAAEADYLRRLTFRLDARVAQPVRVALPVRLIPRATGTVTAAAAAGDIEHAIAWEIAALLSGRTIGELGLLVALSCAAAG